MGNSRRRTGLHEQYSRERDGRRRRFVAHSSNRDEDRIEKADTALAAVAAALLDGDSDFVCVVTTDLDAGKGVVTALEANGFENRVRFENGFELIDEIT